MSKTRVVAAFHVDVTDEESKWIRSVLIDALAEFQKARDPLEEYVERRYAEHDPHFRKNKREQVGRRVRIAELLLASLRDDLDRQTLLIEPAW